ncbi:DUF899 domain-containing protein [Amycolatopsis roodepoortensis]|uniref:Dithiol-disulfide oxidoreductase (DUF899 family) n=1 Tax=Amycolatopsis roodepoortensis TaxID=700274 RepID=A0ABR9L6S7_9PSEU|nr:DUF899 domain-containing protein [Amycolatopsis roodepoortensis]MBE1576306.1 putative dithiol-disulfide oxidoreductase (DUF899 family) [Amycolatopsis roodepoortensis]UUV29045.1 DUF899 domain-containing protein [Amycolatopsis roodepoortensis]
MTASEVVSREEWTAARAAFLAKEKELTKARDEINAQRRALPRILVEKDYTFQDPERGELSFSDLFEGRRQLIVYHFMMLGPSEEFCTSCSFWIDNIGHLAHLHARDTTLIIDCPAPLEKIQPFKERMGWTVPWVSSLGSDFYQDFHVSLGSGVQPPGISAFVREGETIQYAYSTHGRGSDLLNTTYNYLDLTPLGRQEEGLGFTQEWVRHHDRYENADRCGVCEHAAS